MTRSTQGTAPPVAPEPSYEPETTTAERLARIVTLVRRARPHLIPMVVIAVLGCAFSLWSGMRIKRQYQSECTVALRAVVKPGGDADGNAAKRNARLKDMLYERARLEGAIKKFNLYPEVVESRGILDATEAMGPHVGLRARESGRYVISFDASESESYEVRTLVRDVAQYLAESVADDYVGGNMRELKSDASFLAKEVAGANEQIDDAVKKVTTFLSKHPEFASEGSALLGVSQLTAKGTPPGKGGTSSAATALKQTDPILAALWRERARLEADLKTTETPPSAPPAPNLSKEAAATNLESAKKRFAEAQADLLTKSGKLTPEHPDMKTAQAAVTQAAQQLADAKSAYAAFDTPVSADAGPAAPSEQQLKLAAVIAQIEKREKALKDINSAKPTGPAPAASTAAPAGDPHVALETEWQRVLRALGESKSRHEDLKKRFEAAELALKAAEAAASEAAGVIEPAYRPTHPMPSKRAITAIMGGFASIFLALLYGLARVTLDERMYDAGDIEALGLVPVLGTVPEIESKQDPLPPMAPPIPVPAPSRALARLETNEHALSLKGTSPEDEALFEGWPVRAVRINALPNSAPVLAVLLDEPKAIAALRVIRHRLEIAQTKGMRVIAVTSPREGEGKSTVAAQLAVVLAESQRARVVLVEGNLVRPSLARILGFEVPPGAGLSAQILHALKGGNDPWQLVALGPSIHVLAESSKEEGFPRVLHSAHFQQLIAVLAEIYDFVIVDGPSILGSGDANAVEMAVDGMVVVARSGESRRGELRKALRQIGAQNAIGAVLTGIPAEREPGPAHR